MAGKDVRRITAEMAETEDERLRIVLNQGLDEWLRAYIVNQLKTISAQPNDPTAVDRAMKGAQNAIRAWKRARALIAEPADATDR